MTRVLFLCGKARQRSPTAAEIARDWPALDPDYAGLSQDADEPLTVDHLARAELIFVMERRQKQRLTTRFGPPPAGVRVISLDIPDRYAFMEPALCTLLRARLIHHFGPPG